MVWVRAGVGLVISVRANIHLGGKTEFCPNGERKLFVTWPRQREKNNNELLQSLFFDGSPLLPHPKRISANYEVLIKHVLCFARIMSTLCPN